MYIDKTIRDAIRSASHRRGSVASLAREAGVGEDLFGSWLRFRHRFTRAKTWAKVYPVLKQDLPQGKYVPESEKQMQLPLSATVLQRLHQVLIKAIQTQVLDSLTVPEKLQFLHLVKVALVNKHEFEYAAQTRDLEKELRPVQDSVPAAVPVPAYGIEWTPEQEPVPVSTKPHPLTFGAPLFKEYECNKWELRRWCPLKSSNCNPECTHFQCIKSYYKEEIPVLDIKLWCCGRVFEGVRIQLYPKQVKET
jgi:hypothetical protein